MEDHNLVKNTLDQIPDTNTNTKCFTGLVKEGGRITGGDMEYLKSIPDGSENNNLGNLPSVSPEDHG